MSIRIVANNCDMAERPRCTVYLDPTLRETIENGSWEVLKKYILDCLLYGNQPCNNNISYSLSGSELRWALKEFSQRASESELDRVTIFAFPVDYVDLLLTEILKRGLWRVVRDVVVFKQKLRWVVSEAIHYCQDGNIATFLACCADDQLEDALKTAVRQRLWKTVYSLLSRGVSESMRKLAVEEAIQYADDDQVCFDIFTFCTDDQLEMVLHAAESKFLYNVPVYFLHTVAMVLERGVSETKRVWAIKTVSRLLRGEQLDGILSHCTDDELEPMLKILVQEKLWRNVWTLLMNGPSDELRRWAVEQASECADDKSFILFLTSDYWDGDQRASLLDTCVDRGLWESTLTLLQRGLAREQLNWVVLQMCKRASEEYLRTLFKSSHTFEHYLDIDKILPVLLMRDQWLILCAHPFSTKRLTDSQCLMILKESSERARGYALDKVIQEYFSKNQEDLVLPILKEREQWQVLCTLIGKVTDTQRDAIIREACKRADESTLEKLSIPDHMVDGVLVNIVSRGFLRIGNGLLQRCSHDSPSKALVAVEALKHIEHDDFGGLMFDILNADQRDYALRTVVTKQRWTTVTNIFLHVIHEMQRHWVLVEAGKYADERTIKYLISLQIRYFGERSLDAVLEEVTKRDMWTVATALLQYNVSEAGRRLTVQAALGRTGVTQLKDILPHCTDDQLHAMLTEAVTRGLWFTVEQLLRRGPSDEQRQWTIRETFNRAEDEYVARIIQENKLNKEEIDSLVTVAVNRNLTKSVFMLLGPSEHWEKKTFTKEQIGALLKEAVSRGFWETVLALLVQSETSYEQKAWVVIESSKHARGSTLEQFVDTFCVQNRCLLESVLPILVARKQWEVLTSLNASITVEQKISVITAAIADADEHFLNHFLKDCPDSLIDSVVKATVKRGFWRTVSDMLQREISDSVRRYAVEEATTRADDAEFSLIICHCCDDQLESALTATVKRRLWQDVDGLIRRGGTDTQIQWTIEEASKYARNNSLIPLVENHKGRFQPDCVLTSAVQRGLWGVVWTLISGHAIVEEKRRWAVDQAIRRAYPSALRQVVCYCAEDQLSSLLTRAVRVQEFDCVKEVLARGVSESQRRWAVWEASKHAYSDEVLGAILSYSSDDQTESIVTEVVKRRLWELVNMMLENRSVSDTLQTWVLEEASRHATGDTLTMLIQNNCASRKLDGFLLEAARRDVWTTVWSFLNGSNVSDETRSLIVEEAVTQSGCRLPQSRCDVFGRQTSIFSELTGDAVDLVLKAVVSRRQWDSLAEVLPRGGSQAEKGRTMLEASRHVADDDLLPLLCHCPDDHVDLVLTECVNRQLWNCVCLLLEKEMETPLKQWAVTEVGRNASVKQLGQILPVIRDNDLAYAALTETVTRGLWEVALRTIPRPFDCQRLKVVIGDATRQWTTQKLDHEIQALCERRVFRGFENPIFPVLFALFHHRNLSLTQRQAIFGMFCKNRSTMISDLVQMYDPTQLISALVESLARDRPWCDAARVILTRIGQSGDPLVVNFDGRTVLDIVLGIPAYHALPRDRYQLLLECVKLGISTHQPAVTAHRAGHTKSPLLYALQNNDSTLLQMLFESGACSVHEVYTRFQTSNSGQAELRRCTYDEYQTSSTLKVIATNPRSLKSVCRLVISHHVGVGCRRQENVNRLPLPDTLRDYLMFSDLENLHVRMILRPSWNPPPPPLSALDKLK